MKIYCSLIIILGMIILVSGCNTVRTGNSSVSNFPKNTVVIRNHTSYTLVVWRNGIVWKQTEKQNGMTRQIPVEVRPFQELVLFNAASHAQERIALDLCARGRQGCVVTLIVRTYHFNLHAGTNSSPILVTIRSTGF